MEIALPFLAEGVDEATASCWKVDEGDHVDKGSVRCY